MGPIEEPLRFAVKVNRYIFNVETIVKCVDLCFKTYFALNAKYPRESEQVYMYLQKHIYSIETSQDKHFVSVSAVKSDIDAVLNTVDLHSQE